MDHQAYASGKTHTPKNNGESSNLNNRANPVLVSDSLKSMFPNQADDLVSQGDGNGLPGFEALYPDDNIDELTNFIMNP